MIIQWKKYMFRINEIYGSQSIDKDMPEADVHAYFNKKTL